MASKELNNIFGKAAGVLQHRDTPWDTNSLGVRTNEIVSLEYANMENLRELVQKYLAYIELQGILFSYCRLSSEITAAHSVLQENGFYYAETSIELTKTNLQRESFKRGDRRLLKLILLKEENDIIQVRDIAYRAFDYSRFHDDPHVKIEKARSRFYSWIDDLIRQGSEIVIYKTNDTVHGFMAVFIDGDTARLMLGGSDVGKGFMSLYLWKSVLFNLQQRGIRSVTGLISVRNISIFNMYISLGFTVKQVFNGFHRFVKLHEGDPNG